MSLGEESDLASSYSEMDHVSDPHSDFIIDVKATKRKQATSPEMMFPKKRRHRMVPSPTSSSSSQPDTLRSPATPENTVPTLPALTRRRSSEKGKKQSNAVHMYEAVRSGQSALVTVVDDWLEDYKQDREEGLLELINFVVQCCSCKGVVTREMFNTMQNADIISHLTKEFNEDSGSYPLVMGGTEGRRFRESLCEVPSQLVRRCQNSLLYDEFLFSSLLAFLTGLSDSQVRAFRHTSTLIAMHLMSAIVEVAAIVYTQGEMTERRCQLEKNKSVQDRAIEKLEELQNSYNELLERQEELHSLMNGIFKGVFVHRYRDRVPEIRAICMKEMGVWLREYPTSFLNDGHLKYMGWMLNDKQANVRLQCVLSLQKLYAERSLMSRLDLFTSRFKERMLNMVLDKDPDVAVETVRLLLLIKQGSEDYLTEKECSSVYPLVFASHRGLASAAGEFLYYMMSTEVEHLSEGEHHKQQHSAAFLNLLTCFFIQSKYHEHAAYLVDSLWGVARAELTDWNTMTSLLLHEKGAEQGLEDAEEGALIELMMSAVRQAAEATGPASRVVGKRNLKGKKLQAQERRRITNHFILLLPQLLAKFSTDAEKVSSLLKAPLYFELEAYASTGRLEKYLEMLLSHVCDIMEKHHEECVLEACVHVLCALCSDRYTFSVRSERAVSQFLDATMEKFNAHLSSLLQGTADEDDVYSAATSLKRLAVFSSARDITAWKLLDSCFLLLKTGMESGETDQELMVSAMRCAVFHLLWKKLRISHAAAQTDKAGLKMLQKEVRSFCLLCQSSLSLCQRPIRDQAFVCLCDMLVIFGQENGRKELHSVTFSPDDTLKAEMGSFVMDYIFIDPDNDITGEDEDEFSNLQRRRNQLAGYSKLILFGVLELRAAADIFKCYNKFYRDYGDIIKETLSKSKLINPVESAKVVCLSLQQLFSSLRENGQSEDMKELRDLAKKLAMSFGVNLQHIRRPLLQLHQDGIQFAADDHSNLSFLELLSEFSFKLIKQDRTKILNYLRQVCGNVSNSCVNMYEHSLRSGLRESSSLLPRDTPAKKRRRVEGPVRSLDSPVHTSTVVSSRTAHKKPLHRLTGSYREISSEQSLEDNFMEGLSLIEEDFEEAEEPLIEDYDDEDSDSDVAVLPSTRHSTSFLEELFE